MLIYRCYLLDETGRIDSFIEVQALSDTDATTQARRHGQSARRPFELWRLRELICRG